MSQVEAYWSIRTVAFRESRELQLVVHAVDCDSMSGFLNLKRASSSFHQIEKFQGSDQNSALFSNNQRD